MRAGRGFSLAELKVRRASLSSRISSVNDFSRDACIQEAGIPRKFAPTIGISVDPRRANLSTESLAANVERLKAYRARLIIFPRKAGQHKKSDATKEEVAAAHKGENVTRRTHGVMPVLNVRYEEAIGEMKTSDMGKGTENAYRVLREARSEARLVGVREKRAKSKAEEKETAKK